MDLEGLRNTMIPTLHCSMPNRAQRNTSHSLTLRFFWQCQKHFRPEIPGLSSNQWKIAIRFWALRFFFFKSGPFGALISP
jgi:hypothetical protein